MKTSAGILFSICILFSITGFSQNKNDIKIKQAALEIIKASSTCALVTVDQECLPRVRAMDPFLPEDDFTIWFGTNPHSRKVNQIKKNQQVTLYYLDSDNSGYVMIQGTAKLVDDKQEKEKHWKSKWEDFYPNKDENYLLIKVTPVRMEVSSEKRGIRANPTTWEPASVVFE